MRARGCVRLLARALDELRASTRAGGAERSRPGCERGHTGARQGVDAPAISPTRGAGIVEAGIDHDGSRRLLALGLRRRARGRLARGG